MKGTTMEFHRIHFSLLTNYAVRGPIERGRRYIRCHVIRNFADNGVTYFQYAKATEIVASSNIFYVQSGPDKLVPAFTMYHNANYWPEFAADRGLYEVPGVSYYNQTNYLLDVLDLINRGILVEGVSYDS